MLAILVLKSTTIQPLAYQLHPPINFELKKNIEVVQKKTNSSLRNRMFGMLAYGAYTGTKSTFLFDALFPEISQLDCEAGSYPGCIFSLFETRGIRLVVWDSNMIDILIHRFGKKDVDLFFQKLPQQGFQLVHDEPTLKLLIRY